MAGIEGGDGGARTRTVRSAPPGRAMRSSSSPARAAGVTVVAIASAVLLVAAGVAGWMKLQLLDTDTWVATNQAALDSPEVRSALATTLVDKAYAVADPQQRLQQRLPANLDPFAAPVASALRTAAYDGGERALASPQFAQLWEDANRRAHERLVDVVDGDAPIVASTGSSVTIDLRELVRRIGARLGVGAIDGSRIPDSVATVSIPETEGAASSIEWLRRLDRLALWLALISLATLALAFGLASELRRTVLAVWAATLVLGGLAVRAAVAVGRDRSPELVDASAGWTEAVRSIYGIATEQLVLTANAVVLVGALALAGVWVLGSTRWALAIRRTSAPLLRRSPLGSWMAFALVLLGALAFVPAFASRSPEGTIVLVLLAIAGYAVLTRAILRSEPSTPPGHAR